MACSSAGNSRHIQALVTLAGALRSTVQQAVPEQQRIQTVNDFLFRTAMDGVNMFKLLRSAASPHCCPHVHCQGWLISYYTVPAVALQYLIAMILICRASCCPDGHFC